MVQAARVVGLGLLGAALGGIGVAGLVPDTWLPPLIGAAAGSALLVGGTLLAWRQAGGYDLVVAVARAARTGVLPDDADPRVWVRSLERYARDLRTARWRYPIFIVPMLIALEPGRDHPVLYTVFCLAVIAFELGATVDALIRAPGVARRVEAMTGRLATRRSADLRAPV